MRVLLAVLTVGILCAGLYLAIGPGDRLREKGDTLAQDSRAQSGDLQTEDASLATDGEVTEDPVIARSEGETERKGDRAAIVEADSEPATAATGMDSTGPSSVGQLPSSQLRVRGKGDSRVGSIIRGVIEDLQERGMSRATAQSGEFSSRSVDGLIRLDDGGNIQAYIYTRGTGEEARAALEALGARIEIVNEEWGIVQAWIPFDQIDGVAELELVKRIETPDYGVTEVGSVTTEGDSILRANLAREFFGFTGAGIKVGVISDGVESRASAQASGDLPATIEINPDLPGGEDDPDDEGSGDEGTALLEIIHDLAPDASLAFSGGSDGIPTSLEMVQAIDWMVKDSFNGEGADIVVDDLGFLGEPYFEDGPVAQKVKEVVANGTVYLSSAGNDSDEHYEGDFSDAGNGFHDFGGGDRTMRVTLREDGRVFLQWNDKFGSSGNDYDLYGCDEGVTPSQAAIDSGKCIASTAEQNGDDNPKERLVNTDSSDRDLDLYIKKISGSARRLEMQFIDARVREHNVSAGSVFGHKAVLGALAVGAVNADDSGHDSIAPYSSQGPSEIYFPIRETRIKPDIVAIDGVSVTGAGNFPSTFFGTSAAAPHAAAVAALVLEAIRDKDTAISKAEAAQQVSDILRDTATDLGEPGVDNMHGAGRVDAFLALTGGNELINFEQSTFSAVESLHPVVVTVLLTGALKGEILIPITLTNNGALTTDYIIDGLEGSAPNFLLRIPAKALSASFTVTAKADEEDEDGEEFILEFGTSLPPGVIAGPTAAATVNLFDKEDAPGVCGRGTQVRKAILGVIGSVAGCADVTPEDLGKVTELWLRSERIPALARIDLEGLINLEKLHLHLNELTTLHEGVFEDLTNLKLLNLAGNQLATLHAGVFDGLTNLKLLYLGANQLTELPAGLFDGLTSLKELHLASNELTAVPAGVFDGLASLEWLNLGGNQLTALPVGVFAELVNLEWLYLGENQLTTLPGGVFENLVGLRELYLQTNQIASLPAGVFQGLGNLRELNLGDGQLATLPAEIFHSLSSLVTLSLRTNQLSSFPVGVFDGLTSLEGLLLEDNQLTTLPAGVFEGLGRLEYLALYRNPLDNLPAGVFKGLASLVDLDLELNPFTTLPAGVFEGLTSLEDLSLFGNQLSVLPAGVFVGLANLLQLDLRSNQLTILQSGVFDGLTKLRTLQLSGNQLTSLSPGAFAGLNSLIDINLEDNPGAPFTLKMELERVGLGALSGTAQLRLGVAEGAPFAATATWAATGPLIGTRSNRVTIPGGSLKSEPFSVTGANGGGQVSVSLSEEAFRVDSGSSVGLRLTTGEPLLLDFGPNQSPVATGQVPANADIAIGSAMTIDLSKYFDDPDGGPLTYSVSSSHTLVARVSLSGDIVTIFPAAGGSATVTAGASDPGGLSVTQKFPVTVDGDHVGLPTGDWTPDLVSRASFSNVDGQTTIAFEHGGRIDDEGIIYTCMSSRGCTIEGRSVEMGRIQAAQALAVSELLLAGLAELVDDKTVFFEKTYNGFELNESTVTTRSVAGEITRVSFLDLDGDLVFADFSSDSPASEMIVNLDEFSGTLEASPYNQPDAQYARGLATIWIMNPTEHTWLSVVSLGNHIDRVDLALVKDDTFAGAVNGMADIRAIHIEGDGSIGAIDAANANFVGSSDEFGIDAAGTVVRRALTIGDLAPSEAARPLLRINGNSLNPANVGQGETLIDGIRIAGGDLAEATGDRQIDTAEVRYQFPIVAEDGELSIRDSNLRPDLGDGQLPAVTDTFVANPDSYFVTDGQTTGIGDTAD